MHFSKFIFFVLISAAPASARPEGTRVLTESFLAQLRAEARNNHPSVEAAQSKAKAAGAGRRAIRLWEDPMAMMSLMAADKEMRREDGDVMFGAEQQLPRRRLYEAQREKAAAEQAARIAEVHGASVNLEMEVAHSVIELALMDESLIITGEQLGWMEKMAATSRDRASDPQATSAEPLRAEAELAQENQSLDAMRRERDSMTRRINLLLGRPMGRSWPRLTLPDHPAQEPSLRELLTRVSRENPHLAAMSHMANAAAAEVKVTEHERDPVFSINAETSTYSGVDFRQATVGIRMTLPWLNDPVYRAGQERARHEWDVAEFEREASERKMRSEVVMAFTSAQNAARQAAAFASEVIPRRKEAAEAVENAWVSSKAMLIEVLAARNALLTARLEHRRRLAAQRAALEKLRAHVPGAHPLPRPALPRAFSRP
ncbi:MAG: TolC family protein [Verrucomicrobiales bacterium]